MSVCFKVMVTSASHKRLKSHFPKFNTQWYDLNQAVSLVGMLDQVCWAGYAVFVWMSCWLSELSCVLAIVLDTKNYDSLQSKECRSSSQSKSNLIFFLPVTSEIAFSPPLSLLSAMSFASAPPPRSSWLSLELMLKHWTLPQCVIY